MMRELMRYETDMKDSDKIKIQENMRARNTHKENAYNLIDTTC